MNEKLKNFIITFLVSCVGLYCVRGFTLDLGNLVGIVIGNFIVNYCFFPNRMED